MNGFDQEQPLAVTTAPSKRGFIALSWLLAALDPDDVDHALRAALNVELGKARWASGDRDMAKKAFADAMASARIIQDAELFGRAAILSGGRRAWRRTYSV